VRPVLDQRVEGLGDRCIASIVTFGGHTPLGGRDIAIDLGEPLAKQDKFMGFLGCGVSLRLRTGLLEQPLADGLAAAGLVDQFHERVHQHGRQRAGCHRVMA
ncbi:MAG: hypothetical protein ACK559_15140, partial [bacterium]